MSPLRWYGRVWQKRITSQKTKLARRPPGFEVLEDRLTPAIFNVLGNGDATDVVTQVNPGEFTAPTLRAAIDAANDELNHAGADTIVFDLPAGQETIFAILNDTTNPNSYGPTTFVIASNITIQGNPNEPGVIIDGNGSHRLFAVMSGCTLTLEYVTLSGGHAQGGNGGAGSGIGGGGGAGLGGAIFNEGTLNILHSTLNNNTAQGGNGGASNFTTGTAGSGGGMGGDGQTSGPGGGPNGGAFPGGAGGFGGGGGAGGDSGTPTDGGNGGFGGGGGGISIGGQTGGTGGFGGGGSVSSNGGFGGGNGNTGAGGGAGMGGAIFNHAGSITIVNSTIAGNTATGGAGGTAGGVPGRGLGGGIFNRAGTLSITNSTIADNTVAGDGSNDGGGIYNLSDGGTASVTLLNSIIAANITDADIINHQTTGTATLTATTPNIVETLIVNTGGTVNDSGVFNAAPLLGALANNGGPTRTMLPGFGSPAIDAGDNSVALTLATDQRGGAYARQVGLVDIGAVEAPLWGHARFIANLYADVLGRAPDAAGYRSWVGVADTVGNRQAIADAFWESAEHRSNQIDSWYQEFLTRNPDAPGKNGWLGSLLTGGTEEQVILGILNSAEYQALHPTDTGFVTALYNDLLVRNPETAALNDWVFALGQGTSRAQVIDAIVDSLEHAERWVIQFYQVYLDRTPDAGTSRTWGLAIQADALTLQDAVEQILASDEYFLLSP